MFNTDLCRINNIKLSYKSSITDLGTYLESMLPYQKFMKENSTDDTLYRLQERSAI